MLIQIRTVHAISFDALSKRNTSSTFLEHLPLISFDRPIVPDNSFPDKSEDPVVTPPQ